MPGAAGKRSKRREGSREEYRRRLAERRAWVSGLALSGLLTAYLGRLSRAASDLAEGADRDRRAGAASVLARLLEIGAGVLLDAANAPRLRALGLQPLSPEDVRRVVSGCEGIARGTRREAAGARVAAFRVLRRVDPARALEMAPGLLADARSDVVGAAADSLSLAAIDPEAAAGLASRALERIRSGVEPVAVAPLLRLLGRTDRDLLAHALGLLERWESEEVRRETAVFARGLEPELRIPAVRRLLGDAAAAVRAAALDAIGDDAPEVGLVGELLHLVRDPEADVRWRVLPLLARSGHPRLEPALRAALGDRSPEVRRTAVELLGAHGSPASSAAVLGLLNDPDWAVRRAAIPVAARLAPAEAVEALLGLLCDSDESVRVAAVSALESCLPPQDRIPRAIAALERRDARGVVPALLGIAMRHEPDRAIRAMLESESPVAPVILADMVAASRLPDLQGLAPDLLTSPHSGLRMAAIDALRASGTEVAFEDVLPLARDGDAMIRLRALQVLGTIDDPRVFGEIVSSLRDIAPFVRQHAEQMVSGDAAADVPALRRFPAAPGDPRKPWEAAVERVEEVCRWASRVGQELLGTPVVVHQYRQGLGRTQGRRSSEVHIEVSDVAMTSGHRHGEDIVRGLALHEIGHHLFDNAERGNLPIRGIARSEGVGDIYDLLLDERLERLLRNRRPEWGRYLDRLASYAFTQDLHDAPLEEYASLVGRRSDEVAAEIRSGGLPGTLVGDPPRVEFRDVDLLSVPGAIPPGAAFALSLRSGVDPSRVSDARVRSALSLIPPDFRELPLPGLLELAKRIGDVLGRTDDQKRELREWWRRLRRLHGMRRRVLAILNRMLETHALPGWMEGDAPGIRGRAVTAMVSPPRRRDRSRSPGGQGLRTDRERDFDPLAREEQVPFDPAAHAALVARIRPHVRRLRAYLERLGRRSWDEYAARRGRRIDPVQVRKAPFTRAPNLLVSHREEDAPDLCLEILIDRSGSMHGEKIERAKAFGALVAESARGLRGIEGHVSAFDGYTFFLLGDFRRNAIASLTAQDGNNDAGGLLRAAELAFGSGKRNKLIVMISDGSPTECSVDALRSLVRELTDQDGVVCAQVAVDTLPVEVFPHHVDLSRYGFDEAVARFGQLLVDLTERWR